MTLLERRGKTNFDCMGSSEDPSQGQELEDRKRRGDEDR
jgi:hypothetical protein